MPKEHQAEPMTSLMLMLQKTERVPHIKNVVKDPERGTKRERERTARRRREARAQGFYSAMRRSTIEIQIWTKSETRKTESVKKGRGLELERAHNIPQKSTEHECPRFALGLFRGGGVSYTLAAYSSMTDRGVQYTPSGVY